jgi:hypothetical protein
MNRLSLYVLSGLVAVGLLFRSALPALSQAENALELAPSGGPLISSTPKPATVVDSTGAEVGPFENIGGADSALQKIGTNKFALQVNSKGFVKTGVTFSFKTIACTGTRYVLSLTSNSLYLSYPKFDNGSGVLQNYSGGVAGSTLYYAMPKTSQSVTINSELVVSTDGKTTICYPLPATKASVSDVATTVISTLPFVPPFKLSF